MREKVGTRRDFMKMTLAATMGAAAHRSNILRPERVLGANDRVRVAIIGAGDRALGSLVPALNAYAKDLNFEFVALCDIWKKRREEMPGALVKVYGMKELEQVRNTDELYDRKDIDAVIIGTADFQHAYHAVEAVRAGKDVYVEKPFANVMSDAREALSVIGGSKQIFQVGTQRRSTPSYQRAKEYLGSGKFGDIVMAEMTWNVNQPGRWRRPNVVSTLKEEETDWKRFLVNRDPNIPFDARKYIEFRLFWPFSSGIPDQWMVHQIDTVHWFTGIPRPRSVVANGGVYLWKDGRRNWDTMTAVFDYHDAERDRAFQVLYTSRMTNATGDVKEVYYSNAGKLDLNTQKVTSEGGLEEAHAQEMGMKANLLSPVTLSDEGRVETVANTGADSQTLAHMHNWMQCVRNRNRKTSADIHAAYNHSVALCMTIAAIQSGKRVTFDEKKQEVVIG